MSTSKHIVEPKIGEGIYTTPDVAEILKLSYPKVRYLMNSFWYSYTFGYEKNKAVNFYTMIEFYVFFHLREAKITSKEIKKFHTWLSKEFKTKYPFASIEIRTLENKIFYYFDGALMKADKKKQPVIKPFIEPFLNKIEFGNDLIAKRYFPLGEKSKNVVVDPLHQFGQPIITGTNIQTATINNLYKAGETKSNISILYDISANEVNDAIKFYYKNAS